MPTTHCMLCPRACGANRADGQKGYCGADNTLRVARAALHFWEEPFLCSEYRGSGTVFFSGCALKCSYCQNRDISTQMHGKEISVTHLAEIFSSLEAQGAANINLVTPDHYAPQVSAALSLWKQNGGALPVVLNTGGYITEEALMTYWRDVDIFLTDFKYITPALAEEFSRAPNYPTVVKKALDVMVRLAGTPVFDEDGFLQKGVVVRHLLLPGHVGEAQKVTEYVYNTYGDHVYISLMNQFTPISDVPGLNRSVTVREYDRLLDYAVALGVENCMIQEFGTAKESFIPPFDGTGL